MRANQYRRAFSLLSEDCQLSWGSPEAFAEAQGARRCAAAAASASRRCDICRSGPTLRAAGHISDVAELDVEYEVGDPDPVAVVRRVVHLVPGGGPLAIDLLPHVTAVNRASQPEPSV